MSIHFYADETTPFCYYTKHLIFASQTDKWEDAYTQQVYGTHTHVRVHATWVRVRKDYRTLESWDANFRWKILDKDWEKYMRSEIWSEWFRKYRVFRVFESWSKSRSNYFD